MQIGVFCGLGEGEEEQGWYRTLASLFRKGEKEGQRVSLLVRVQAKGSNSR